MHVLKHVSVLCLISCLLVHAYVPQARDLYGQERVLGVGASMRMQE